MHNIERERGDVIFSFLILKKFSASQPCLEDGPGRDHDDECEGDGREGPDQAGQCVRLHRQSDGSPGRLAAQQHWQSSAESSPAKHRVNFLAFYCTSNFRLRT